MYFRNGQINSLRTPWRHILTCSPVIAYHPFGYPPKADRGWKVKEDDRICAGQPHFEAAAIVAVNNPTTTVNQLLRLGAPELTRGFDPSRVPEMLIQVNQGQPQKRRQPGRQRRFAGSRFSDYEHTLHYR